MHELKAKASHVRFWQVPTLAEILAGQPERYPLAKTYEDAKRDPAIIIHSSGSTGKYCCLLTKPRHWLIYACPHNRVAEASSHDQRLYRYSGQIFAHTRDR